MRNPLVPLMARIKCVKTDTSDTKTYSLKLKEPFQVKPGQFNMVGYPGVGEAPISISSSGDNGVIEHTIRSVGRVTGFISSLDKGDEVSVRGPYGRGWPMEEAYGSNLILAAGGLGLAPLKPVIQTVLKKRDSFGRVVLIYGARNEKNTLYINEMETWKGIETLVTVDEAVEPEKWKYGTGSIITYLAGISTTQKTFAFICGPEIMMRFACNELIIKGLAASRLYVSLERRMKCGIGHCGHCQHGGRFVCKEGPVFSYREVRGLPDGLL